MVVGFTTTNAMSAYHHYICELESHSWQGVLDTTLCDKCIHNVLYQNRSPQAGKRENWQFADLSRLQFTSDESEFIPDYF